MPISDELKKLYATGAESGLVIKEFPASEGYVAFAARRDKLENAGFSKEKVKTMDFMMASLYMAAGAGDTREEAVKKAMDMYNRSEGWIPQTKV